MSDIKRRRFLGVVTVAAGGVLLPGLHGCSRHQELTLRHDPQYFPQSIASGDPRPESVILWTRVHDPANTGDALVRLQVAQDPAFEKPLVDTEFKALSSADHTLKVRVTDLQAGRHYHFRFIYLQSPELGLISRVGRTRTAPAEDADVAVTFAQVSCQGYSGRYFNTYLKLLQADPDFFIHLGDYIYETTGDSSIQNTEDGRQMRFSDRAGALPVQQGARTFLAARALDNYRELYRTCRTDPVLQRVHERIPMIAIWDDHEFSDDCWQDSGNYSFGRNDEHDLERRRNAEQAFFEYMPVDPLGGAQQRVDLDRDSQTHPNARIWRDFRFGRHLHLLMTDYRSHRPDHLIAEDAFPGTVVVAQEDVQALLREAELNGEAMAPILSPYIDVDATEYAPLKSALTGIVTQAYMREGLNAQQAGRLATQAVAGPLSTTVVNALIDAFNAAVPAAMQWQRLSPEVIAQAPQGIAHFTLGKIGLFSELGARLFVVKDTYDLYARSRCRRAPACQNAFGQAQDAWLKATLKQSTARWKMLTSSVSFTSMVFDLTDPAMGIPEPLNKRFYMNLDQWDGLPDQRREYVEHLFAETDGLVLLSGDIHAAFVTEHAHGTVEFTAPAISSRVLHQMISHAAQDSPLDESLVQSFLDGLEDALKHAEPGIRYANTRAHGLLLHRVDAEAVHTSLHQLPAHWVRESLYEAGDTFNGALQTRRFRIDAKGLQMQDHDPQSPDI